MGCQNMPRIHWWYHDSFWHRERHELHVYKIYIIKQNLLWRCLRGLEKKKLQKNNTRIYFREGRGVRFKELIAKKLTHHNYLDCGLGSPMCRGVTRVPFGT